MIHVDKPVVGKVWVERESEQTLFPVRRNRDLTELRWDELPLWIDDANPSGQPFIEEHAPILSQSHSDRKGQSW